MKRIIHLTIALGFVGGSLVAQADVLELKNGTVLHGTYAGGSAGVVRFNTASGTQAVETTQIISLTFTTPAPAAAPTPTGPAPAAAAAPTQKVTLPAGTLLLVRMMDSVSSKNQAGATFTTKLEYDVAGGSTVALKGGTVIYGKVQSSTQAGRARGRSTLDLCLTKVVVNGQPVPLTTSGYQEAGQASIAKAAKGAAAGAAIGAIAGDAGKGAAIGAASGAVIRGQTITVPPGTLLEFTLTQPVVLPAAP